MLKPSNTMPKGNLRFTVGDATLPIGGALRFILQVNNDIGAYGAGFSGAVAKKWPAVRDNYRMWWRKNQGHLKLGEIQEVMVQSDIRVINMIAQKGIVSDENPAPIDYEALNECLNKAGVLISREKGAAHMPRIGCGLAGGTWEEVEPLVIEQLCKRGINVTVYDLN